MEHKDMVYRSSPSAIKEFMKTTVWLDMERDLTLWLEDIRNNLESSDVSKTDKLQGNAEAVRNMLALPQTMIDNIEEPKLKEEVSDGR